MSWLTRRSNSYKNKYAMQNISIFSSFLYFKLCEKYWQSWKYADKTAISVKIDVLILYSFHEKQIMLSDASGKLLYGYLN